MAEALEIFEGERAHLMALGYRLLGSVGRAEDGVQETWIRWSRAEVSSITSPKSWLRTVMTRWCLDELKSARHRRESYVGPWLPEPILEFEGDPLAGGSLLRESLSVAFLLLMERLSPLERAVFILRDVFDYDHGEIAEITGKRRDHCRQLLRRAKAKLEVEGVPERASLDLEGEAFLSFGAALEAGDVHALVATLGGGVILLSDGGGKVSAALRPIQGVDAVSRLLLGLKKRSGEGAVVIPVSINGGPGGLIYQDGALSSTLSLAIQGGKISGVYITRNPDKLSHLPQRLPLSP